MNAGNRENEVTIGLFGWLRKNNNTAIAFVDYEYWFYSYQNRFRLKTDPMEWRTELEKEYNLKDIMIFGDFSNPKLSAELPKLRTVTNTIVETGNSDFHRKKDMTDFIMLDYIYQTVTHQKDIGTFILFTGDGHFQSVVKYITQQLRKKVVVYGVKDTFSNQLRAVASETVQLPAEDTVIKNYYPMIISNLAYVADKPNIVPTFMGTVEAVARKNGVPEDGVKAALCQMIDGGLIYQRPQRVAFNKNVKIVVPNWEKLIEEGYWKP